MSSSTDGTAPTQRGRAIAEYFACIQEVIGAVSRAPRATTVPATHPARACPPCTPFARRLGTRLASPRPPRASAKGLPVSLRDVLQHANIEYQASARPRSPSAACSHLPVPSAAWPLRPSCRRTGSTNDPRSSGSPPATATPRPDPCRHSTSPRRHADSAPSTPAYAAPVASHSSNRSPCPHG